MDLIVKIGILASCIGGLLGIVSFFQRRYTPVALANLKTELTKLINDSIQGVEESAASQRGDVEVLKKQMGLFWSVLEKQMSTLLHSPHRPDLDKLLDKNISRQRLTRQEAEDLVDLLYKFTESGELTSDEIGFAMVLIATTVGKYELDEGLLEAGH